MSQAAPPVANTEPAVLKVSDAVIAVLQKPAKLRSQAEVELLFAFVVQIRTEALLRRLDLTALRTLCSTALEFQEWDADSLVFAQGDVSTCCYVILSGSISIWIKAPVAAPSADTSGDHSESAVFESEKDIEEAAIMTDADEIKLQTPLVSQTLHGRSLRLTLGDCIGRMTASAERSSFGELGLLEGRMRSASILAETKLQCLVIRRDAFEATIKAVYRAEFDLKVKTLRSFSALRSSSDAFLKRLQIYTNLVTLSARAPIYRKGDKLSVVYLIISGEVELLANNDASANLNVSRSNLSSLPVSRITVASLGSGQLIGLELSSTIDALRSTGSPYLHMQLLRVLLSLHFGNVFSVEFARQKGIASSSAASTTPAAALLSPDETLSWLDRYCNSTSGQSHGHSAANVLNLTAVAVTKVQALAIHAGELVRRIPSAALDRIKTELAASEELRDGRLQRLTTQSEAHRGLFRTMSQGPANNVATAAPTQTASQFVASSTAASNDAIEAVAVLDEQERAGKLWQMQQRGSAALLKLLHANTSQLVTSSLSSQHILPQNVQSNQKKQVKREELDEEEASVLASFQEDQEAAFSHRFGLSSARIGSLSAGDMIGNDINEKIVDNAAESRKQVAPQIAAAMAAAQRRMDVPSQSPNAKSNDPQSPQDGAALHRNPSIGSLRRSFHTLEAIKGLDRAKSLAPARASSFSTGDEANSRQQLDLVAQQVQRSIELELRSDSKPAVQRPYAHNELVYTQQQLIQAQLQPKLQALQSGSIRSVDAAHAAVLAPPASTPTTTESWSKVSPVALARESVVAADLPAPSRGSRILARPAVHLPPLGASTAKTQHVEQHLNSRSLVDSLHPDVAAETILRPSISSLNFASSMMFNQIQSMSKDGVMGAAPSAGDMYHAPVSDLMIQQQHNHAKQKSEAAELAANAHLQSQLMTRASKVSSTHQLSQIPAQTLMPSSSGLRLPVPIRSANNSRGPSPLPSPQLSPRHQTSSDAAHIAPFRPHVPLDPKHSNQLYTLDSLRAVAVGGKIPAVHQLADALNHQSALSSYGASHQSKLQKRRSGNF